MQFNWLQQAVEAANGGEKPDGVMDVLWAFMIMGFMLAMAIMAGIIGLSFIWFHPVLAVVLALIGWLVYFLYTKVEQRGDGDGR